MDQVFLMGIRQPIQYLTKDQDKPPHTHGSGTFLQHAHRKPCSQHGVSIDDVGIFQRHNMRMPQLGDQADLTEDRFVITPAKPVGIGDLKGHPDAFNRIPGLPYLAVSAYSKPLLQPVFAQTLP